MEVYIIFTLIFIHWVADFVFQRETIARKKAKDIYLLFIHAVGYSLIFFIFMFFGFYCALDNVTGIHNHTIPLILLFVGITFVTHFLVDFVTSKISHKLFKTKVYYTQIPNFGAFTIIGLDQLIHYIQLFLTYHILFR